jgi:hypothetical protein
MTNESGDDRRHPCEKPGRDRKPGGSRADRLRDNDRPSELKQCRVLWARLDGPRDGDLLRGSRPDYCGDHGVEEEQHVRDDRIPVFRVFLADPCRPSGSPETGTRRCDQVRVGWRPTLRCGDFLRSSCSSASLKTTRALQLVLGLLTVLFFLLAIGEITGNANVVTVAGYEGILTGFVAIYAGLAQVLNEMYKRTVAPLG